MQLSKQYGFTGRASCGLSSGFALPVSAQIKADSALLGAAGAPLIALTEPAPALRGERRLRGPTARCSAAASGTGPRPPSIMSRFFLRTEANFYSRFQTSILGRFSPKGLLRIFFLKELTPQPPQKSQIFLNSERECRDVLCRLGSANCSLTIYFRFETRRKTLRKYKVSMTHYR